MLDGTGTQPTSNFSMRLPWAIRRYRLTNRRVVIERGINPRVEQYVDLDRFDAIDVLVSPGQEWYGAGDLLFRRGQIELRSLSRAESIYLHIIWAIIAV
ncbi:MAG: PH domain-containing protein, partial [Proteobacteria bacterium]|nr:PH domain-containing protein [Pseudomonadota bacterium]